MITPLRLSLLNTKKMPPPHMPLQSYLCTSHLITYCHFRTRNIQRYCITDFLMMKGQSVPVSWCSKMYRFEQRVRELTSFDQHTQHLHILLFIHYTDELINATWWWQKPCLMESCIHKQTKQLFIELSIYMMHNMTATASYGCKQAIKRSLVNVM